MSHLEDLLHEYYEWQGYVVRHNVKVGHLKLGGWEGELDIVAYHPTTRDLLHLEPSIDALPRVMREKRLMKKFQAGQRYIFTEVFPWLDVNTPLTQIAVLVANPRLRTHLAGGVIRTVDQVAAEIRAKVAKEGRMALRAISEQYPLLRTIQLVESGYVQLPPKKPI